MLQDATLRFLKQLAKNNNKEWFDKNRGLYEVAKKDFLAFLDAVILKHGLADPAIAGQEAKSCMFRINRDIRFSKNKAPYKKNFAASMTKGGKKSKYAGYYFHLEPGNSFIGGGLWMPEAQELKNIRQEIDYNLEEFEGILKGKGFRKIYGKLDEEPEFKLSRPPRGYEEDNPAIEYLKLKSFIAMAPLSDEDITGRKLEKKVLDAFAAVQPLLAFLNRGIEE